MNGISVTPTAKRRRDGANERASELPRSESGESAIAGFIYHTRTKVSGTRQGFQEESRNAHDMTDGKTVKA